MYMIKTINLSKIYRTDEIETAALTGINLEIAKGELIAIMGSSGCGKSSLLNLLGMIDKPDAGEYFFNNAPIAGFNEKQKGQSEEKQCGLHFSEF